MQNGCVNSSGSHLSRRAVLQLGGLGMLNLTLPKLLASDAQGSSTGSTRAKSCILFFLEGGPSHIDLWDMKPDAPAEVRGEFQPIQTTTPGLQICEHLPLLSEQMGHLALVRSVTHNISDHNAGAYYAMTGKKPLSGSRLIVSDAPENFPPIGSVLAKLRPSGRALPDFIQIPEIMFNNGFDIPAQSGGFFGAAFDPFLSGDPSLKGYQVPGLVPRNGLSQSRLEGRNELLGQIRNGLGRINDSPVTGNPFHRRALDLISSTAARKAFDLSLESDTVRNRYGLDPGSNRAIEARKFGGLPHLGQCMLLARRLIEAGTRLVTVISGRRIDQAWDTHRDHFPLLKQSLCPMFDRAFSAMLEDMALSGLLEDTLIVALGEFGRTPRLGQIVSPAGAESDGRDHWPYCYTVMFAGAGIPGGAIYGSSDRHGAYPSSDPVTPEDIAATVYKLMGVSPDTEIHDQLNRPHLLSSGQPIEGLMS